MSNIFESLKRHVVEYFLFYILLYGLTLPAWLQLVFLSSYKNIRNILSLPIIFVSVVFVFLFAILKHEQTRIKLFSGPLLLCCLILQLFYIIKFYSIILSSYILAALVVISIVMSVWSVLVYFYGLDKERNKFIGKEIMNYFLLSAVLFYVPTVLLGRYYKRQINKILAAGSVNVDGGLNYDQIVMMIDAKIGQASLLQLFLTAFVAILFFFFYRKVKNSYEHQLSGLKKSLS